MTLAPNPNPVLSQHFIDDPKTLKIMASLVARNDAVIEIGAGAGNLTKLLAQKAKKVIAIEIDRKFESPLIKLQREYKNIDLIFDNALNIDFGKANLLVSNLPYNITEPFLNKLAKYKKLKSRVMAGQKFAEHALLTDPDDPNFTEISFLCSSFFDVKKIADVPKKLFNPAPKTDSVIIDLVPKKGNILAQNLFLSQEKGSKIKNFLMNGLIILNKKMSKNEARKIVSDLKLPSVILDKSFAQLNNEEVRTLAAKLRLLDLGAG